MLRHGKSLSWFCNLVGDVSGAIIVTDMGCAVAVIVMAAATAVSVIDSKVP